MTTITKTLGHLELEIKVSDKTVSEISHLDEVADMDDNKTTGTRTHLEINGKEYHIDQGTVTFIRSFLEKITDEKYEQIISNQQIIDKAMEGLESGNNQKMGMAIAIILK